MAPDPMDVLFLALARRVNLICRFGLKTVLRVCRTACEQIAAARHAWRKRDYGAENVAAHHRHFFDGFFLNGSRNVAGAGLNGVERGGYFNFCGLFADIEPGIDGPGFAT